MTLLFEFDQEYYDKKAFEEAEKEGEKFKEAQKESE
jgi:hypothetical protein